MVTKPVEAPADGETEDLFTEPKHKQLAALCFRKGKKGTEILMVTSSAGRWILPKGWPMKGKDDDEAAMIEAWEEGGVKKGKVWRKPIGKYLAGKVTKSGDVELAETKVYRVKVKEVRKKYPESKQRDRKWVSPKKAVNMVTEDGLRNILKSL